MSSTERRERTQRYQELLTSSASRQELVVMFIDLEEENERLREAIDGALALKSTYDYEHHGVVNHLISNQQARHRLEEVL